MPSFLKFSFLALATLMTLSGCTLFSPVKNENTTIYIIDSHAHKQPHKRKIDRTILVTTPETNALYNTLQLAYTTRPHQVDYYIKSQWAETPSQMFLPLITRTLAKTHHYQAVASSPSLAQYDYLLNTNILELLVDFTQRPASVRLVLRAELISMKNNRVVAVKEFSIREPLPQYSPYGGVLAANRASSLLLGQLARFCLKHS